MLMRQKPNIPKTIYLDQNKWIDLSRAYYQQPLGIRFAATIELARAAVKQGTVRFPLSRVHIMETMKHGNISRRRRLARVLVELSQGWTIAPQQELVRWEYDIALAGIFNKPVAIRPPLVFGRGVEFACGQPVHVPILLDSPDEETRKKGLEVLTVFLSAPTERLRKLAVDPYNANMNASALQADRIRNLVIGRDRITRQRAYMARQVFDDLRDLFNDLHASLARLGLNFLEFLDLGPEGLAKFYEDVPTLDVLTKLKIQRNNDFNKRISANDLSDLTFLSVAIPYCDVVVRERQWVAWARERQLEQKYKTVLLDDLAELENYITA